MQSVLLSPKADSSTWFHINAMTGRIHYLQIYFKHFAHFDKRYVSFELKK